MRIVIIARDVGEDVFWLIIFLIIFDSNISKTILSI